jgi:hypothetical protein
MPLYNQPYPATYQNPYQPYSYPNDSNGIIWVQGESGAKAYPVQNGKSVVLFDSESEHFFIKTTDISGMPQPLRIFSYKESNEIDIKPTIDTSNFITRDEFEKAIDSLKNRNYQRRENRNGKPIIQRANAERNDESV